MLFFVIVMLTDKLLYEFKIFDKHLMLLDFLPKPSLSGDTSLQNNLPDLFSFMDP